MDRSPYPSPSLAPSSPATPTTLVERVAMVHRRILEATLELSRRTPTPGVERQLRAQLANDLGGAPACLEDAARSQADDDLLDRLARNRERAQRLAGWVLHGDLADLESQVPELRAVLTEDADLADAAAALVGDDPGALAEAYSRALDHRLHQL